LTFPANLNSDHNEFITINQIHPTSQTKARLNEFEQVFAGFTDLLLNAQQYGPDCGAIQMFPLLQSQLQGEYCTLKPFLLAYLQIDPQDQFVGLRTLGTPTDAFEATWIAPSLKSFVDSDDVFFRDRVARAKAAIKDYTEHLHCLLETRV
jgi:hypothetical protein